MGTFGKVVLIVALIGVGVALRAAGLSAVLAHQH